MCIFISLVCIFGRPFCSRCDGIRLVIFWWRVPVTSVSAPYPEALAKYHNKSCCKCTCNAHDYQESGVWTYHWNNFKEYVFLLIVLRTSTVKGGTH
jgi:hypothetical protein